MDALAVRDTRLGPLHGRDLPSVVELDAARAQHTRRDYFERRLAAARREPDLHIQFAATDSRGLAGYLLARVLEGEFGLPRTSVRLEAIGARHDARGAGLGARLLAALCREARERGAAEIRTAAAWNDHAMLRWLDGTGFRLAAERMLERAVGSAPDAPADLVSAQEMAEPLPVREGGGTTPHIVVSAMQAADLPDVARVDHAITGRLRDRFLRRRLAESLADATVRVSLTARRGGVVVGYVMARVDAGDFGRIEPAAVIDSVGVDPAFGGRGVGRALFAQLLDNLAALHVERVETVVAPGALALNAFLHRGGFAPGQRIAFVRALQA